MQKPHEFVLNEVQCRWSYERSKGFFRRLLDFGANPIAIDIIETESLDEKEAICTGEILNKWRQEETGLRVLSEYADMSYNQYKVEKCWYCIDREKKRVVITWANLLPGPSSRKGVHHFHNGTLYEIIENNGIEEFKAIGFCME